MEWHVVVGADSHVTHEFKADQFMEFWWCESRFGIIMWPVKRDPGHQRGLRCFFGRWN